VPDAHREAIAAEIEAEAATHLLTVRRGMRWAAWVARGKPAGGHPGEDHEASGALLRGDAERSGIPCCPVEDAARADERQRAAAGLTEAQRALTAERARYALLRGQFVEYCKRGGLEPPAEPVFDPEDAPRCIRCGCTDERACPGGCTWVPGSMEGDVCSRCAALGGGDWSFVTIRVRVPDHVDADQVDEIERAAQEFVNDQWPQDDTEDIDLPDAPDPDDEECE
jgi:hypothetical protein